MRRLVDEIQEITKKNTPSLNSETIYKYYNQSILYIRNAAELGKSITNVVLPAGKEGSEVITKLKEVGFQVHVMTGPNNESSVSW